MARGCVGVRRRDVFALGPVRHVPAADPREEDDRNQREDGEGENRVLPERHDDKRGEQRTHRLAEIAADLEEALGEAVPSA